jgi:hypothetical protein
VLFGNPRPIIPSEETPPTIFFGLELAVDAPGYRMPCAVWWKLLGRLPFSRFETEYLLCSGLVIPKWKFAYLILPRVSTSYWWAAALAAMVFDWPA